MRKIKRGLLIYEVVEPVGEKKTGVRSPLHKGSLIGAVIGEVVLRELYRLSLT